MDMLLYAANWIRTVLDGRVRAVAINTVVLVVSQNPVIFTLLLIIKIRPGT